LNYAVRTAKNRNTLSERHSRSPAKRRDRKKGERKREREKKEREKSKGKGGRGRERERVVRILRDFLNPTNNSRLYM